MSVKKNKEANEIRKASSKCSPPVSLARYTTSTKKLELELEHAQKEFTCDFKVIYVKNF